MNLKAQLILLSAILLACGAQAQERSKSRHQFGVQIPVWFNAKASFSARRATNPGPNDGNPATDRFYDDGFNRVDSTGNAVSPAPPANYSFPRTSFFGYLSDAQATSIPGVTPATDPDPALTGGTLALHSVAINGGEYTRPFSQQPLPGIEFFYRYDWLEKKKWSVDLEAGISYQHADWEQAGAVGAMANVLTDIFGLGGVVLPAGMAPFSGLFANTIPGAPVIGSTPTRSETTVAAIVTGRRNLRVDTVHLRLGPALEWRFAERWRAHALAGVALGLSRSSFDFTDSTTVADPTVPTLNQAGSGSGSHLWVGAYTAVRLERQLSEKWEAHAEVRRIWQESYRQDAGIRSANIDAAKGLGVVVGLSRHF
jgi:hypothetical protein